MELKRMKVQAHDEPEFANIGTGTRRVLVWTVGDTVHIFNQPNFVHEKMSAERFAIFKPTEERIDPKATAKALAERRDFLGRAGAWDGGELVSRIIQALLDGAAITEEELGAIAEMSKPTGKVLTPADLDKEAKPSRKKKEAPAPTPAQALAPKDRVKRRTDKDAAPELGTVVAVGPEQTDVKWDSSSGGVPSGEPNNGIVKAEEAPKRLTKKEQAAKFKSEQPKETEAMATKAKKKKAAAPTNGAAKKKEKKPLGKIKLLKANWKHGDKNPRREGTKAGERAADMLKYLAKHPNADASEVIANTKYRGDDLNWDIKNKLIELK